MRSPIFSGCLAPVWCKRHAKQTTTMTKDSKGLQSIGQIMREDPRFKPPSRVQLRMIEHAADIHTLSPLDISYQHTLFCQTVMPYRRQSNRIWEHRNGRAVLRVEAGSAYHPDENRYVDLPLPFGPKVRLVQIHLDTQAIRNQSAEIEVEDSLTAFVSKVLGHDPNGREIRDFKTHLGALSASLIRLAVTSGDQPYQVDTKIVTAFNLWFPKDVNQRVLWPSVVKLSTDYFQSLIKHAVPLDPRAVAALAHNAMALDIYRWLAQRLLRLSPKAPALVPWTSLHAHFGVNYKHIRKFRQVFNHTLKMVLTQYPAAKLRTTPQGLLLYHSRPPVERKLFPASR